MKVSKLRLTTNDLECVVSYLNDYMPFNYNYLNNGTVILTNKARKIALTNTSQNSVILKQGQNHIDIDIIEGEWTGESIFHIIHKPENKFILNVKTIFDRFCDEFIVRQKADYSVIGA